MTLTGGGSSPLPPTKYDPNEAVSPWLTLCELSVKIGPYLGEQPYGLSALFGVLL